MTRPKLTPLLIAIDALLVLVLAALWLAPGPLAHWRDWQAPAPQAPNLDDVRAAQLTPNPALGRNYPAITERPLFAADRKPRASAGEGQTAAPPDSLDQAKLYGLVNGPAAQGVLLEQGGQSQFVRRGEKIGAWTLQAIEERNAIFVKGSEQRTMPLPDSLTDPAQAAQAAAAVPPAAMSKNPRMQQPMPQPMPQPMQQPMQQPAIPPPPYPADQPMMPTSNRGQPIRLNRKPRRRLRPAGFEPIRMKPIQPAQA